MKQIILIFFLSVNVLAVAQTQSIFGTGVEVGQIKNTFLNRESLYAYVKYKTYAKPSLLILDPSNAFGSGATIGAGVNLNKRWSLGISYNTLPYTRYQMSQIMVESGIDLLTYFSDNAKVGFVTSFALGTASVKGVQGIKLSTRPSVSLNYKLTKKLHASIGGEINLIHHTNTKFLTYLSSNVGISYIFDTKRHAVKPAVAKHPVVYP